MDSPRTSKLQKLSACEIPSPDRGIVFSFVRRLKGFTLLFLSDKAICKQVRSDLCGLSIDFFFIKGKSLLMKMAFAFYLKTTHLAMDKYLAWTFNQPKTGFLLHWLGDLELLFQVRHPFLSYQQTDPDEAILVHVTIDKRNNFSVKS